MGKARTVRCNPLANIQYEELLASVSRNVAGAIGILALFGCLACGSGAPVPYTGAGSDGSVGEEKATSVPGALPSRSRESVDSPDRDSPLVPLQGLPGPRVEQSDNGRPTATSPGTTTRASAGSDDVENEAPLLFSSISFGGIHACGLQVDGLVICWGANEFRQATPPAGRFVSVSVGYLHSCGVKVDRDIVCWGDSRFGALSAPDGSFQSVSARGRQTCGMETDGTIQCWGERPTRDPRLPESLFTPVSYYFEDICVAEMGGTIICHESDEHGPPEGKYVSISGDPDLGCGVKPDGTATCWGEHPDIHVPIPQGGFRSVSAGLGYACGVKTSGSLVCWGITRRVNLPEGLFDTVVIDTVVIGGRRSCAVMTNGTAACWDLLTGRISEPAGHFASVSVGDGPYIFGCGLQTDGTVACWGDNEVGQASPPRGRYEAVSAGVDHACGIKADGAVVCWGRDEFGETNAPEGSFKSISSGALLTCGVKTDGALVCWGRDKFGVAAALGESFESVDVGTFYVCAVKADGAIVCWGADGFGRPSIPPPGSFTSVSVGATFACGLKRDGYVACWGDLAYGLTGSPSGQAPGG